MLRVFAGLSLLLAGIGLHGLLSFAVSQRVPEISLRMALGARAGDVLRLVLRQGLILAAVGRDSRDGARVRGRPLDGSAPRRRSAGDLVTFARPPAWPC